MQKKKERKEKIEDVNLFWNFGTSQEKESGVEKMTGNK